MHIIQGTADADWLFICSIKRTYRPKIIYAPFQYKDIVVLVKTCCSVIHHNMINFPATNRLTGDSVQYIRIDGDYRDGDYGDKDRSAQTT